MSNEQYCIKLRELILNARTPIVLRKFQTNWNCCSDTLKEWCNRFDDSNSSTEIEFEQMPKDSSTAYPQWERERRKVKMTMKTFLQQAELETEFWTGLNYQTPNQIPEACKSDVDFSCFGFPHLTNDYARFWLSTSRANTPCHQDTYGCNVVMQVFGSKLWLLFPPDTALTSTRLPYEESSVYCMENFYAPTATQVIELKSFENDAYICPLEAGDVLIVPRFWWHFVETKTFSLSINAWIPLDVDKYAQLEECIVKYIIEAIAKQENSAIADYMLNPNQRELTSETDTLSILAYLTEIINSTEHEKEAKKHEEISYPYQYLNEQQFKDILSEFPNAALVKKSSPSEYNTLILKNSKRNKANEAEEDNVQALNVIKEALINSLCSGNVIKEIVKEFKRRLPKK